MRGALILFGALGLVAATGCGESGPSEAEKAKMKMDKDCGKLYGAQTKVLKDKLHQSGVSGVEFSDKGAYVKRCADAGLTEEQMKCLDPNLGGTEECKKALEPAKDKVKALTDFLLKPMKDKAKGGEEKEGEEGEAEEKSE